MHAARNSNFPKNKKLKFWVPGSNGALAGPADPSPAQPIPALPSAPRLVTGNLSPRDLEFYSSFRTILGKFRESWGTPLTAWLAPGNSDLLHF